MDKIIKDDVITKETTDTGVVYCITNNETKKKYIGQAKSYIQNHGKIVRHGAEGRFKIHMAEALKGEDSCAKLYASVRKHGVKVFTTEILLICNLTELDKCESTMISKFDTVKNGYNIMPGAYNKMYDPDINLPRIEKIQKTMLKKWKDPEYSEKTRKANLEAVIKRAESGKTRVNNKELKLPANIYKTEKGYNIQIMRDGKYKITSVEGINISDETKLETAIKKLGEIKNNIVNNIDDSHIKKLDHNGNDLPTGIILAIGKNKAVKNYGTICGYQIAKIINLEKIERSFIDSKKSMDEKLQLAKNELAKISDDPNYMNNLKIEKANNLKKVTDKKLDHNGKPLPEGIFRYKDGKSLGYQAIIKINGKKNRRCIAKSDLTMEEKLNKAIEYKNEINKLT